METKEDIQSRRQFFKKIGTKTLPFLGAVVLGPAISLTTLTSCGCDGCEAACMDNCEGGCVGSCQGSATSSPCSDCSSTCSGSSTNDTCSSCANNCSSSCSNNCTSGANNNGGGEAPDEISPASGKVDGYEYVDLGLSVKWARFNIGASKPEGYGTYFAFGDPTGNNVYSSSSSNTYYKNGMFKTGSSISGSQYDTAKGKWGTNWRMPTVDDYRELLSKCDFVFISINNHYGIKFISRITGNSIFFPASGYKDIDDKKIYYREEYAEYWTGNVTQYNISLGQLRATCFLFELERNLADIHEYENMWTTMLAIRPVTTASGNVGGCTGSSCSSNCANNSTSNGCTGCSTGCSTSCKTTCEGSCINGCNTLCGGQCRYSCGGTCSYVSAGSSCTSSTCATSCSSYCYHTCTMACSSSCQSQCIYGSK